MSVVGSVFIIIFLVIWLAMLVGIMLLMGFGLWKMCKNAGMPRAWLSFIYPIYNICKLAERSMYAATGTCKPLSKWSLWVLWGTLGGIVLLLVGSIVAAVGGLVELLATLLLLIMLPMMVLAIAGGVLTYYALYYVYKDYIPGNETLMLILSILLGAYPIILLVVMNVQPVSVAGRGQYGQPKYNQ